MSDIQDFIDRIENLTQGIDSNGPQNAWQFGVERLLEQLKTGPLAGTDLSLRLRAQLEGTLVSILAPAYILYQNYGVGGAVEDRSGARGDEFNSQYIHRFGTRKPPVSVFERYANDISHQFAIATNVYKFGIKPKGWFTKDSLAADYTRFVQEFINNNLT
jgi:hypothetical protein